MESFFPLDSEEAYVTFEFKTQRCRARGGGDDPPTSPACNFWGKTTDFAEPDRDIVAVRLAARHWVLVGAGDDDFVLQETFHLKRETEDERTL